MDKTLQRQKASERVKRYRDKQKSVTSEGVTPESVTEPPQNVTPLPHEYPAILLALIDPAKRGKLERVCLSLKKKGLQKDVRYGCYSFDVVGDLLDATA